MEIVFHAREVYNEQRCLLSTVPKNIKGDYMWVKQNVSVNKYGKKEYKIEFHIYGKVIIDGFEYHKDPWKKVVHDQGIFL